MSDILSGLNQRQREAVIKTDGPILIFAGAGSGKTRVLTRKIAYLLEQKKTTANRILAVTFTNKAANEMKERVNDLLGGVNYVNIGTFHSIAARVLRKEKNIEGFPSDFTIYDTNDTKKVIIQSLKQLGIDSKILPPSTVMHYISRQKQKLILPDNADTKTNRMYMQEKLAFIYREYERQMRENNAYDFDDLLMRPILMFQDNPAVAEKYRHRWDYVLVDEYQDTNPVQFELMKHFTGISKNICVVGDDDQSIYGWRGADIKNILEFEKSFPNASIIKLEQNYRSTKTIIEAASAMIKSNHHRADKTLWTEGQKGDKILHKECMRDFDEANYIANKILNSGKSPRDFAILYRTNAQSRMLEEALRNRSIRYVLVGGLKFYERKEIKDILAYLNVLLNPRDTVNLKRIINVPIRGIGTTSLKRLETFATETSRSLWEAFQYPEEAGLHKAAKSQLQKFMNMMIQLQSKIQTLSPTAFTIEVFEQSELLSQYQDKKDLELLEKYENQNEFINSVKIFESFNPNANIGDFLQDVSLQSDIDQWEDTGDAVTLMTIHSAKGLEFKHVFISGMEDGLFPLERSRLDPKEMEEERRLFYVALTRAMEHVTITSTQQRMRYGQLQGVRASEFIHEIPAQYVKKDIIDRRKQYKIIPVPSRQKKAVSKFFPQAELSGKRTVITPIRPPKPGSISVGDKIKHKMFGKGKVRSIIRSSQVLLRIDFDNGVHKTIAEKFVEKA